MDENGALKIENLNILLHTTVFHLAKMAFEMNRDLYVYN